MMKKIPTLSWSRLSGDVWGGFAAMLVALPSAMAFGVTIFAPLGAVFGAQGALAGMLGAMALGLVASAFGGTRRLVSAPCAPAAAVLSALTLQGMQQGNTAAQVVALLLLVAWGGGLAQVLFGVLRIGTLIKFMPFPVVSGYMSGVGFVMVLSQTPKWLALPAGMGLWQGLLSPAQWQWPSLLIGLATGGTMLLAPRLSSRVPAVILGLLGGVATYWLLAWTAWPPLRELSDNAFVIGPLSVAGEGGFFASVAAPWEHLATLSWPHWDVIVYPALTLAVLLSIDTLKTCLVLDALTGARHDSNRELIGQGLGNLVAALVGGTPGSGTLGATLVNRASGGESRLSGVFEGLWSLLAVLLLTAALAWVPVAALAALLIVVGWQMIDWHALRLLRSRDTVLDVAVIVTVALVANTVSLIAASGTGVVLAVLLFLREQIYTSTIRRQSTGDKLFSSRLRPPTEEDVLRAHGAHTAIFVLQGSLFFGTTDQLYRAIEPALAQARFVVLDFLRVQSMDMSAGHLIERVRNALAERQGQLVLTRLPERLPNGRNLHTYVGHLGLLSDATVRVFDELDDGLEWVEDETLRLAGHAHVSSEALTLEQFDLLHGFEADAVAALRRCATQQVFGVGERVFAAGTVGTELMLVARGEVKTSLPQPDGKPLLLATFSRGQFFGEISFLDGRPHAADAHATRETVLVVIDRNTFAQVAASDPALGTGVMRAVALALADRLRQADGQLREMRAV